MPHEHGNLFLFEDMQPNWYILCDLAKRIMHAIRHVAKHIDFILQVKGVYVNNV